MSVATPEEVEPVVQNPRNVVTFSNSTGRSSTFGMTRTAKYIIVVWEQVKERPWTVRVKTAYEGSHNQGSPHETEFKAR